MSNRDFFVSFNSADRDWATWVAWVLEDAGYLVSFQDWDFRGNFVEQMNRAHEQTDRTIAVLSDNYLGSDFAMAEWTARFRQDPSGREDRLVPVKVGTMTRESILGPIVYADLTNCNEGDAARRLLGRVKKAVDATYRARPSNRPDFPGPAARRIQHKPDFPAPGTTASSDPGPPFLAPRAPHPFIGREADTAKVVELLNSCEAILIRAQVGGIGKTSLTAHIIHQVRKDYPGGTFWFEAGERSTFDVLKSAIDVISSGAYRNTELLDIEGLGRTFRNTISDRRALIVLDDLGAHHDLNLLIPSNTPSKFHHHDPGAIPCKLGRS